MKKVAPFERMMWCNDCKKMTKHLVYYVGRDKSNLNNVLYYRFCTIYIQLQYEGQKLLYEEKTGNEFTEEKFEVKTVVESIGEKDWNHLLKGDYL